MAFLTKTNDVPMFLGRFLVEFLGSFFLGFAIVMVSTFPVVFGMSGFLLAAVTYSGGPISGGHFNAAVSLAVYIRGRMETWVLLSYLSFQMLGHTVGALLASWFLGHSEAQLSLQRLYTVPAGSSAARALVSECVYPYMIILVYLHMMTVRKQARNSYFGLAVGLCWAAGDLAVRSVSGAVFNPTLSLAGMLAAHIVGGAASASHAWLYILGPVVAAVAAVGSLVVMNPSDVLPKRKELAMTIRNFQISEVFTEFVCTMLLTVMALTASFGIGFGIVGLIHMAYYISGAELNPMVTLMCFLRKKYSVRMFLVVILAQSVAGAVGGGIGRLIIGHSITAPAQHLGKAWVMELVWTFVLGYVILTVCSPLRKEYCQYYAMGVGFTILGGAFVAGRFSGAVFNPAVGVGVCLAAQSSTIWIYWTACPLAGVIAHFTEEYIARVTHKPEEPVPLQAQMSMASLHDAVSPMLKTPSLPNPTEDSPLLSSGDGYDTVLITDHPPVLTGKEVPEA